MASWVGESKTEIPVKARWRAIAVAVLVAVPIVFEAIALMPELRYPVPSANDDAFHYLFIQRAGQALAAGQNPVDHWVPELELGFPQFFYYQHLPHLTVVGLQLLVFRSVDLLTLFNLVRYLLMVLFPLTVYLSMRRMEFSIPAAAIGAAFSPLLSSSVRYDFDFGSYMWSGSGMYTQLWSMHLMFIATACVHRVLNRRTGHLSAMVVCSALVLSDLLYAYMMAVTAVVLFLLTLLPAPRE